MSVSTAIKQRRHTADYIDVGNGFELMGTGFTSLNDNPAAQTSSKKYVNMASAATSVTSYQWTAPFTFDEIDSEKAIAFITRIGREELLGDDAETDYITVDLSVEKKENGYPARKRHVSVEVSDFSENDGEVQGSGNLGAKSDWEYGYFDVTTKQFTANESARSDFQYAKTLA